MRQEMKRIEFSNKSARKKFFRSLKTKSCSKTYSQLATQLNIPYGRLKLYVVGARTIPVSEIQRFCQNIGVDLNEYRFEEIDMNLHLKKCSKKGVAKLRKKYGKNWAKITGKRSMKKLRKLLDENSEARNKWRSAIEYSLKHKFGQNFYSKMGKIGGPKSIASVDPKEMALRHKRMFRKAFRKKIDYNGISFRSNKEIEVAKILIKNNIAF